MSVLSKTRWPLWLRIALSAAGVILVGWAITWYVFADIARGHAETWIDDQLTRETRISCPEIAVGGFPAAIRLTCASPTGLGPDVSWTAPPIEVRIAPWSPNRWLISAPGRHAVERQGRQIGLDFDVLQATVVFHGDDDRPEIDLLARNAEGRIDSVPAWSAAEIAVRLDQTTATNRTDFDLRLSDLALAGRASGASQLGDRIESLTLIGALHGALEPEGWPPTATELALWRDAGGVVDFESFFLNQGALSARGNGTLALDNLLQPQGAFAIRVAGYNETLTALAARGVVEPGDAAMIGLVLDALAKSPGDGGRSYIETPLSVQDNGVFIGPVQIAKIPPIRWPQ